MTAVRARETCLRKCIGMTREPPHSRAKRRREAGVLNLNSGSAILTRRTYSHGDLVTVLDPRGVERLLQYNASDHPYPTDLFEAYGSTVQRHWKLGWDAASGVRTSEQDMDNDPQDAGPITAIYDSRGRILQLDQSGLRRAVTSYNDLPTVRTTTTKVDLLTAGDGLIQTVKTMDQLGRPAKLQQTDDNGGWVETDFSQRIGAGVTYQLASNPFRPTLDSSMGWTVTTLDTMGRSASVTHYSGPNLPSPWSSMNLPPSTGSVTTQYTGNTATVTDEANKSRSMTVDAFGRLTTVVEDPNHMPAPTTYSYGLSNLTGVLQSGQTRTFVYTSLNRLKSAMNPESGTTSYTYDLNGNLSTRQDARGVLTTMATYDSLNRMTAKSYSDDTHGVSYCYDGGSYNISQSACAVSRVAPSIGRLTDEFSSVSETQFTYDLLGEILGSFQVTNGVTYAFGNQYNRAGGLKQESYPSRVITYGYNSGGRVNQVSGTFNSAGVTYASSVSYAPHFALGAVALGNGLTESLSYNSRLQPTQIQLGGLFTLVNRYDPSGDQDCSGSALSIAGNNGNVLGQTVNGVGRAYSYDGDNRLCRSVQVQATAWTESYSFDVFGNMGVARSVGLPAATAETIGSTAAYGPDNRVSSWAYDTAGNVTGIPVLSGGSIVRASCASAVMPGAPMMRTACYDAENRMVSETDGDGNPATYKYDGDGRRISKTSGGYTTIFVYDSQGQLAQEYGGLRFPLRSRGRGLLRRINWGRHGC